MSALWYLIHCNVLCWENTLKFGYSAEFNTVSFWNVWELYCNSSGNSWCCAQTKWFTIANNWIVKKLLIETGSSWDNSYEQVLVLSSSLHTLTISKGSRTASYQSWYNKHATSIFMHTIAKHSRNANDFPCCATQELISNKAAEGERSEEWVAVRVSTCSHTLWFTRQLWRFESWLIWVMLL